MMKDEKFVPFRTTKKRLDEAQERLDKELDSGTDEEYNEHVMEVMNEMSEITFTTTSRLLNKIKRKRK